MITFENRVIIIAEAGINHNGDIDNAFKLIDAANEAGADFVKFQTFRTELNISKSAKKAAYQISNTQSDSSQFEMIKPLEFSQEQFKVLHNYCSDLKVQFLSTPFDLISVDFLDQLGTPFYKIPSGEIIHYTYLKHIAKKGKPVVMSTGMANMDEIKSAIQVLLENGLDMKNIIVLHCNTEYPTPMSDVNLKAMQTIGEELGVQIGYSDHTLGIEVPVAAVALGAKVIEKHFTLDCNLPGPDHMASLEPDELKNMVTAIRNIEKAISGTGLKEPSPSEKKNIAIARKSLHTLRDLKKGHQLTEEDLVALRPDTGISPMKINEVIGKILKEDLMENDSLDWRHLE